MTGSVSVVIPTFNGSAFIREALESVFAQTLLPAEILVVDDCSTDGTPELVERIMRNSSVPMRIIQLETNSGSPARPINVGVERSTNEFIAVLDHDDVFAPNKLESQSRTLAADAEVSVVFSCCAALEEPGKLLQSTYLIEEIQKTGRLCGNEYRIERNAALRLFVMHATIPRGYPGFMFRRAAWKKRGGVDDELQIASDYEFLCWLCTQGDAVFIPSVGYYRREHSNNLGRRVAQAYTELALVQRRYLQKSPGMQEDEEVHDKMRTLYRNIAVWARGAGHYAMAARFCWMSAKAGVWKTKTGNRTARFLARHLQNILGSSPPLERNGRN